MPVTTTWQQWMDGLMKCCIKLINVKLWDGHLLCDLCNVHMSQSPPELIALVKQGLFYSSILVLVPVWQTDTDTHTHTHTHTYSKSSKGLRLYDTVVNMKHRMLPISRVQLLSVFIWAFYFIKSSTQTYTQEVCLYSSSLLVNICLYNLYNTNVFRYLCILYVFINYII